MTQRGDRTRVLYVAPWVDFGGSDKGTLDWLKWLDRSRFELFLATTQPSDNRRLAEAFPYAAEVWPLPDLMPGRHMPAFLFDLIATRGVQVLHVMNSRLAFELLPDLSALPHRPRVVVQLHVEEEDKSGYVRLVSRRYGNLVDAFSVSSEHLARAVQGYDVPSSRIHVIPTGVDAETEFAPDRVPPVGGLEHGMVHVLYPGRLVEQKDPLLMVEVAALAVRERDDLRFHVVGDGPLDAAMREAIAGRGLQRHVRLHPPTPGLAAWYAAADLLLMTSRFEGVPYVLYEAMAMGLPAIVPALVGNRELLYAGGGELIEPRDDAAEYAAAVLRLAGDPSRREAMGAAGRARAVGELSVREMATRHEDLYDGLVAGVEPPPRPEPHYLPQLATRFARPRGGHPLVSVIVPCFNHGRYLRGCLAAIRAQTWPAVEIIIVDDASSEPDTIAVLDELTHADDVTVLRLERNGGPSRARNAALDVARGRYVLPVDADNLLLEDAIERLVGQLAVAGADVGFVYPNLQYFGNRRDYFEAPDYNLAALLASNFCDTCSLFDAQLFAEGLRFREDIVLGHEDWSLVLDLAAKGIRGEPAQGPTLLYRKSGFTRSDQVEYGERVFAASIRERHPDLFAGSDPGRFGPHAGRAVSAKAQWSPGLSVVALEPLEPEGELGGVLWRRLMAQSCPDFEIVLRSAGDWPDTARAPSIRRIHAALAPSPADAVGDGLRAALAPIVLVTTGTGAELLHDRAFVEKVLRAMRSRPGVDHLVLAVSDAARYPFQFLDPAAAREATPHAVALRRDPGVRPLPDTALLDADAPVESLARLLADRPAAWHHHPQRTPVPSGMRRRVRLGIGEPGNGGERAERERRLAVGPAIPAMPVDQVRRWTFSASWMPPETLPLVRHRCLDRDHRIVTNDRTPPPGYALEFDLGSIHRFQVPGTAELRVGGPAGYVVLPEDGDGAPRLGERRSPECRGFLERAPLPLLDAVELAFHPASAEWVLVSGPDDPLQAAVEQRRFLGFVEPYPNRPRLAPATHVTYGLKGLVRAVDVAAWRHRYGLGSIPPGTVSLELGAVHSESQDGSVSFEIRNGRVVADGLSWAPCRPDVRRVARWAAAPLTWTGLGALTPRARASVRRSGHALARAATATRRTRSSVEGSGYLWSEDAPGRRAVFAADHPVTGDQLLTVDPAEAIRLGYGKPQLLGWVLAVATVTESLEPREVDVPWGSRFGRRPAG